MRQKGLTPSFRSSRGAVRVFAAHKGGLTPSFGSSRGAVRVFAAHKGGQTPVKHWWNPGQSWNRGFSASKGV